MKTYLPTACLPSACLLTAMLLFAGCPAATETPPGQPAGDPPAVPTEGAHDHSHDEADALTWVKEDIVHEGYEINLGLHGPHLHAGEEAEVAIEIVRSADGKPADDAKVFVTLLDDLGEEVIVAEQPTIYEPATDEEDAHYAQASVAVPKDARRVTVRYRIEFPDAAEFSRDVLMTVQ